MRVRFVDLSAQTSEIMERVTAEIEQIHAHTAYIGGQHVERFEHEFAEFLGSKRVVGVANGTDALRMALMAVGIQPGDNVVTVPMTFIATGAAIVQAGGRPMFVDIDPETGNISIPELRKFLESKTRHGYCSIRAVVPVHLYGLPAPMNEIKELADEFKFKIVEDACQAHGARIATPSGWKRAGTIGDVGCFSFYPGKNLGAWGDGGAIATDNDEIAHRISSLANHGRLSHYAHEICGFNSRLDSIQAAVLRAKLARLQDWNDRRRTIAATYRELLAPLDVRPIAEPEGMESCYHLFIIRSAKRDLIRTELMKNEIECGIHYPVPLHLQPALGYLGYRPGDFPASEMLADSVLSLPMHPHLTVPEIARTVAVVAAALRDAAAPVAAVETRASFVPRANSPL